MENIWSLYQFTNLPLALAKQNIHILFFHTLSGCDTTSAISGNGEKVFFETCKSMEEITWIFQKMPTLTLPNLITEENFELPEKFVLSYIKTSNTFKSMKLE